MKNSLISIIVPVYNASQFIWRCLDSLLWQTYKNIEIVLIDDWSKDNSLDIINEYKNGDNRIIVISQKNQWAWIARNNGIKISTWDFITFVDSDDALESDAIGEMVKYLNKNTDIIISWIKRVDKDWNIFEECIPNKDWWLWMELKFTATQFKLYKRDLLINNNIEFWSCKIHEDLLFNIKAYSLTNNIKILPSAKYLNYQHCSSESLTLNMKNEICNWEVVWQLINNIVFIFTEQKKFNQEMSRFFVLKTLIQDILIYKSDNNTKKIYLDNYKFIEKYLWKIWFYRQKWETFSINFIINFFVFFTKIRAIGIILWLKKIVLDR